MSLKIMQKLNKKIIRTYHQYHNKKRKDREQYTL